MTGPVVLPADEHNTELVENAHPSDWIAPEPAGRYNLVVIGGGTAGLVSALGAAALGARVALVEKRLLGGDCLNFGCVPSKAVMAAADVAHTARTGGAWGVRAAPEVDFAAAMERMRQTRAAISHHDSAERLARDGVDVFLGAARFSGPDTVEVDGTTLRFARAVIATGTRPLVPAIPGAETVHVRTNEDIFELTELPRRLVVLGGGPTGCELAQAFRRFGSEVALVVPDRVLPDEEIEASELLTAAFEEEGIAVHAGAEVTRIGREGDDALVVLGTGDGEVDLRADEVLAAVGHCPNVEGLDLERAGVTYGRDGVTVDGYLRTTNPRVYAAGDVCSQFRFSHAADAMAKIVLQNALFFGFKKVDALTIPWATYTDPEVAHVGISGEEADRREDVWSFLEPIERNDRSLLEGETRGYVRIHALKNGTILGATVVARHAGELIGPLSLAMTQGLRLGAFASTIFPYPTRTEVLKRAALQWQRTRLTPLAARVLRTLLRFRR